MNSPFPDAKRQNGYSRDGKFYSYEGHYDDSSTIIFIPKNFQDNFTNDIVFYFHGMRNNIFNTVNEFRIIEQFYKSKKNAILILTETAKNTEDNCGGKFESIDGFKYMLLETLDSLYENGIVGSPFPGNIILAGHSGAYRIIINIIQSGGFTEKISEIFLFDALYGDRDKYFNWIKNYNSKFIDIYSSGGGTLFESFKMTEDLRNAGIEFISDFEDNITGDLLEAYKYFFIYSNSDHNGVIGGKQNNFTKFLKASCLKNL